METTMANLEAQLKTWSLRIDRLAEKTEQPSTQPSFDTLIRVDELKALRAIAQSKLDGCRACAAEMKIAMADLDAAFSNDIPPP